MKVKQSELAEIVARSTGLSDRLSVGKYSEGGEETPAVQQRLERWCEAIAQGNWEKFHKRLAWDGWDIERVKAALRYPPRVEKLPGWAETLRKSIEATGEGEKDPIASSLPGKPLPFTEVLLPAIGVGRQLLSTRCQNKLELLLDSAYLSLERSLLVRLIKLSGKTLQLEFTRSLPLGQRLLNRMGQRKEDPKQRLAQYNSFVEQLHADGMLGFFQQYPVLGRLLAIAIDLWVEATAELIERLQADIREIGRSFNSELGKVIEIETGLSDPHNGGKSVAVVTFESGLKLVYKPKDLGTEVAYTQLLAWCNKQGVPLPFKVLKILNRQTHGWVEYVEHLPCADRPAAVRFYQRSGMLLCLLYALRVTDCHRENLIANDSHLVLVDMETLMHHEVKDMVELSEETAAETVYEHLFDSVLRTGLLPRWDFRKDDRIAKDISALGSVSLQRNEPQERTKVLTTNEKNVPILNGVALDPNEYLDEIVTGFEQMYQFLMAKREAILADDGPLAAMRSQRVRFIFRPTRIYGTILQKTQVPKFLRDGVDRSIELDRLSCAFTVASEKPNAWPILQAELRAMEQLDIPYFAAQPDSEALTFGLDKPLEEYFQQPSYQEVMAQIEKMSEADLADQIEIIKGSFYARRNPVVGNLSSSLDVEEILPLSAEELLAEATGIAEEIQKRAIWGADGSVKWISFGYIPNAERFQLMPLPEDLYNGNGGISLFFAALDYIRGTDGYRELILGALQSLRQFLQTADMESKRIFVRQGLGGATGLGSIIYCLVKIGQFLGESELLTDARGIADLITPKLVQDDRQFDIIAGTAGTILGLLALHSQTEDPEVLDKAIICGRHLLAHQVRVDGKPQGWQILGQQQYTGFSHGAAGIAYALLKLYAVTQDSIYLDAARQAIAYENSIFSPTAGNWPDLRSFARQKDGQPGFMVSWCHGATGIGLGRLGGLSILATEEIQQDIEVALQTTQRYHARDLDSVCCGNFGQIELLLVAAEKLSRPELRTIAAQKAAGAVRRAQQTGGYRFLNLPNGVFSPSFFQGTAGIGYQLLRLAHPERLPSVLLLA